MKYIIIFLVAQTVWCQNIQTKKHNTTSNKGKTLLAVFAHSDDEATVAPILSKYSDEGVKVYVVLATDGSKGVQQHANIPAGDSLAKVRAKEALCTTQTLKINPPILLKLEDGNLSSKSNMILLTKKIDSLFRELTPDAVITWGPDGGYGHIDHRIVSDVVTEVFQKNEIGVSKKLFYVGYTPEMINSLPPLKTPAGNWLKANTHTTHKKLLTYRIPYSAENFKLARQALDCCQSQATKDVMDDTFKIFEQSKGYVYLRPWLWSEKIKNNIFE